ncbi:MAG: DUF3089 domain-containing protein [Parvularcula sp.]|jgi:hypothetical protein|nr:DUF3089 domain-containing protein [Parvularcula sp.]
MKMPKGAILGLSLTMAALIGAAAWYYQDVIGLWLINPDRTYEAYTPPPAPDYEGDDAAWLARGEGDGFADVFYIHSNVYDGDGNWNAPFDRDSKISYLQQDLLPVEAGPFASQARLWAPRFRQPTLFARFTQKHPGVAARELAYQDIETAFGRFLEERESGRPFILAGYGDGALFAGRLFKTVIAERPELQKETAAVYAVGMPLPNDAFAADLCLSERESGCVVAFAPVDSRFTKDAEQLRTRTLTLGAEGDGWASTSGRDLVCLPPPVDGEVEAVRFEEGEEDRIVTELAATCRGGLLMVAPPAERALRQTRFFGSQWRPSRFNLFYEPLRSDAQRRVDQTLIEIARDAQIAPPMAAPEDVGEAEINVVPNDPPTD